METGILPPELKSIEQLFTADSRFSVPKYQRNFTWGTDEIEELWEDILFAIERKSDYFLGTIVLHKKNDTPIQEIIDGQQRLTCIVMIFSAIRNVFLASNDDRDEQIFLSFIGAKDFSRESQSRPKLVLNRINNECFVQYIVESKNYDEAKKMIKTKGIHLSNKLLLQAYNFFLEKVITETAKKGTKADEFLVPLIDCLRSSVKFITIPVMSDEDANLFFESLNARGKELAVSDLVKNRLFYESGDQVERAQNLWEQVENEITQKPIPEYLRHFWIAKISDEKNLRVREKQLYRAIAKNIQSNKSKTIELLVNLASSSKDYAKISEYSLWPDDDAYDTPFEQSLHELKLFGVAQCNPLLLNAIQNFNRPKDIAKTFRIVVNFSLRYFIIGNQSPGNLERETAKIAYGIRTGIYTGPKDIADSFRGINSDRSFYSDFLLATLPKSRAKIARHILAKINNHLQKSSNKSGAENIVNPDAKMVTLEHVLPQNFSEAWKADFSKGSNPTDYVHRIGNLTLLTRKVNAEAADSSFKQKKMIALEPSSLLINNTFSKFSKWSADEIDERQVKLAKIATEIWKL